MQDARPTGLMWLQDYGVTEMWDSLCLGPQTLINSTTTWRREKGLSRPYFCVHFLCKMKSSPPLLLTLSVYSPPPLQFLKNGPLVLQGPCKTTRCRIFPSLIVDKPMKSRGMSLCLISWCARLSGCRYVKLGCAWLIVPWAPNMWYFPSYLIIFLVFKAF